MANYCRECIYWENAYISGNRFGQCSNLDVFMKLAIEKGDEDLDEDEKTIFTEEWFGCVHWAKSDNVITKLPNSSHLL